HVPDRAALAMALIENIQREDLNPLEEAAGIQRLIDEFEMTHDAAAQSVGRSRSAVSNLLRLLNLPKPIQNLVMDGKLEMGHARALLALNGPRQIELAQQIAGLGLSVREAEALVGRAEGRAKKAPSKARKDRDLQALEEELSDRLATAVSISASRAGHGKLVIKYSSLDQLDELLLKLRA
ncbi:MAG: ParB/RepB/Spo0J family partition protein, partial [Burkholderiales bacterium]